MIKFNIEPYYEIIIKDGQIKILSNSKHAKGRELSQYKTKDGYLRVKLNNKHHLIHHLICDNFLGKRPDKYTVNHIDGNKLNNLPENLEYVTINENIQHAIKLKLHVSSDPKRSGRYKDGRCSNINEYKRKWYHEHKKEVLERAKLKYERNKERKSE